jgi:transposase
MKHGEQHEEPSFSGAKGTEVNEILIRILCLYSLGSHILKRAAIIIEANTKSNNSLIAQQFYTGRSTVRKWRNRMKIFLAEKSLAELSLKEKVGAVIEILSDAPRGGTPATYKTEVHCKIMALALRAPKEFGRSVSHWALTELTAEVHKQGISKTISRSSVARVLAEADIRPHKSRYWLTPKIESQELFDERVYEICEVYRNSLKSKDTITWSVDEKTGIQALEFINPSKPVKPGMPEKIEFEYKRHGTLCLTPSFNVATGKVDEFQIRETRNEQDFAEHIEKSIKKADGKKIIFVSDQLNTHKSETLVRLIAKHCKVEDDLGEKGENGILKSQLSRMAFLEDNSHHIRFVYTPRHCSWMNQVEIWFGILSRKMLKRSSFKNKEELEQKMREFIEYFNENLAKPFRWTYEGKALKK